MFANRFTVLVDACSLFSPLTRNLLLSLAEGEFFRLRWSAEILGEVERAIARSYAKKGVVDGAERAARARGVMERAFEEATVTGYEGLLSSIGKLPDVNDAHVIAAAVKTRASVIVTENLKHFPKPILKPLDLEAKRADEFIADTIDLDTGRAIPVIRRMRQRFKRPEKTAEALLLDMEASGLTHTVDSLRAHLLSL
jgi:predicted nucleic acid-binding protein